MPSHTANLERINAAILRRFASQAKGLVGAGKPFRSYSALATALGMNKQNLNNLIRSPRHSTRKSISAGHIAILSRYGVDVEWVLYGKR